MSQQGRGGSPSEYPRPQPFDDDHYSRSKGSNRPIAGQSAPPKVRCGAPEVPDQGQEHRRPHSFLRYTPGRDGSLSGQFDLFSSAMHKSFGMQQLCCSGASPASVSWGRHIHVGGSGRNTYMTSASYLLQTDNEAKPLPKGPASCCCTDTPPASVLRRVKVGGKVHGYLASLAQ